MGKIFEKIHKEIKKIPKGRVTTYGEIAKKLKVSPRTVGWALNANKNPAIPCHRVVNREGRVAKNYAFGGWKKQKEKLSDEGVKFRNKFQVDLKFGLEK